LVAVVQVAPKAVTRKFLTSHLQAVVLVLAVHQVVAKMVVLVAVLIHMLREEHQVLVFLVKEIMVVMVTPMSHLVAVVALAQ
jgi:hypothetical protein